MNERKPTPLSFAVITQPHLKKDLDEKVKNLLTKKGLLGNEILFSPIFDLKQTAKDWAQDLFLGLWDHCISLTHEEIFDQLINLDQKVEDFLKTRLCRRPTDIILANPISGERQTAKEWAEEMFLGRWDHDCNCLSREQMFDQLVLIEDNEKIEEDDEDDEID